MNSHISWSIIKRFSVRKTFGFTFQDLVKEFPGMNPVHLARILSDMVDKGMLCKLPRNTFHIIPLHADPDTYVPDSPRVIKYIMAQMDYYIGYESALRIYGLTSRSPGPDHQVKPCKAVSSEYIVTYKRVKPEVRSIRGVTYHFIRHSTSRFFGFDELWINQFEKAKVSDLEKTIVDIAGKPQYCGGIRVVASVLNLARDRIDQDKLFYYMARNWNKSTIKRILYLMEILGMGWTTSHERMLKEIGPGISLLDPRAVSKGRRNMKFGLKINVDMDSFVRAILYKGLLF